MPKKLGIIGGGQLGMMLAIEAFRIGIEVFVYTDSESSPAAKICSNVTVGSYLDCEKIEDFSKKCDFCTIEFENISFETLKNLKNLSPSANSILTSQNRILEKNFAITLDIPIPKFAEVKTKNDIDLFVSENPEFIIKTATNGYDGKGQFRDARSFEFEKNMQYIIEEKIDFEAELSCILTRGRDGKIVFYDLPRNYHSNGILQRSVVLHNQFSPQISNLARFYTQKIAEKLNFFGTIAVEFFVTKSGELLFNEIAPRVHNSGHYTLFLSNVSQFANHIRAVCNLQLLEHELCFEGEMINIIGDSQELIEKYLDNKKCQIYLYNKDESKDGRKMGHLTIRY